MKVNLKQLLFVFTLVGLTLTPGWAAAKAKAKVPATASKAKTTTKTAVKSTSKQTSKTADSTTKTSKATSKTATKNTAATSTKTTSKSTKASVKTSSKTTAKSSSKTKAKTSVAKSKSPVIRAEEAKAGYQRSGQQQPSAERYQEIQEALVARGYLDPESVTGNWGADSLAGMKRFQQDQKLTPDGKLTALSLTALGLGPNPQSPMIASAIPPPAPAASSDPQD